MDINKIYNMDCLEYMKTLPNECINLIIIDPPYNISKDAWDIYTKEEYINFMGKVIKESYRILKPNGTIYIYNNNIENINDVINIINNTEFEINDFITWNKWNGFEDGNNRQGFYYKVFNNPNLKSLPNLSEFILRITKGNQFSKLIKLKMKEENLREIDFRKLKLSKNGNPTGWCSNIINGKNIPTSKDWNLICDIIGKFDYNSLKQVFNFEDVRECDFSICNVWNINIPNSEEKVNHPTQKPLKICDKIIKLSSNPEDLVYIPFAGSGSEIVSCINNNRNYIATELNNDYIEDIIKPRINKLVE